jgi:hypothetical protein
LDPHAGCRQLHLFLDKGQVWLIVVLLCCGVRLASESESACLAMCQAVGSRQQCYCKAQVSYLGTEGSCVVVEQCQVWLIVSTCCFNVLALLPVHILGHQSRAYFVLTSFDLLRRSAALWVSWGEPFIAPACWRPITSQVAYGVRPFLRHSAALHFLASCWVALTGEAPCTIQVEVPL